MYDRPKSGVPEILCEKIRQSCRNVYWDECAVQTMTLLAGLCGECPKMKYNYNLDMHRGSSGDLDGDWQTQVVAPVTTRATRPMSTGSTTISRTSTPTTSVTAIRTTARPLAGVLCLKERSDKYRSVLVREIFATRQASEMLAGVVPVG